MDSMDQVTKEMIQNDQSRLPLVACALVNAQPRVRISEDHFMQMCSVCKEEFEVEGEVR
ncbi:hypothetical protein Patl1_37634 [Pistacia atlantica]|nr:hypothetical protein Patl1_37634 [Pistacia atlantica]